MSFASLLSSLLAPLAKRFVAGEVAYEAVEAARAVNTRGIGGMIDFLGEDVKNLSSADAAAQEYIHLLEIIQTRRVQSTISLKVSQMGMPISPEACLNNLRKVLAKAKDLSNFVWIDMESSALTQKTIDAFKTLRREFPNVGLCLQAYLVRTQRDLEDLMAAPLSVRICKGAYKEPREIAFQLRRAVDANFRTLTRMIFKQGPPVYPAFATHNEELIKDILTWAAQQGMGPKDFEIQMLYGIGNELLEKLARQGYQTRVYIPYGTAWFPYFFRRLRERPENFYFFAKYLFRR